MTRPRHHPDDRRPAGSPAVVLLSGGLDSATVLAIARRAGHACHCLTFDYGQRHRFELNAASRVAEHLDAASHRTLTIDLRPQGGSALTASIPVPKDRADLSDGIPITYVPARNLIFLSMAIAWCEVLRARHLYIGVNAVDFSGYPDCRPQFIEAFQKAANLATRAGVEGDAPVRIEAPIIDLGKADIIRRGLELGVDFALTHSCYDPDPRGLACAHCDACILRRRGFEQAGVPDPTAYAIGAARHV